MSNTFSPPLSLHRLILHFSQKYGSIRKATIHLSNGLSRFWSPGYIFDIYKGRYKATDTFIAHIKKLERIALKPPRKRYRLTIETDNEAEYKQFESLTMDQRLKAFRNEVKNERI